VDSLPSFDRRRGAGDDGAGVGDGPVNHVVAGGEEVPEAAGDAGFGSAGISASAMARSLLEPPTL
jgi:hypothetical protein